VATPADRIVNPARKNGAHGRTRTCILLIRNQVLSPIELRVRCWLPDQDSNLDLPGNNRGSYRWTIGDWWSTSDSNRAQPPCKGDPRTLRVPRIDSSIGGQTLLRVQRSDGEMGSDPRE
jgi:hypothetical protein